MKASVTVIIFNRPDHAAKLRDLLKEQETRELFVISDGPRPNRAGEREQVNLCRKIFSDWPGRVHFDFAEENMGCKARISSGLDWVFRKTDRTIILEDDLLPIPRFFSFCDEMLDAYAENSKIMSVCGTKVYPSDCHGNVYFSRYANSWGWATWKRAWACYDDGFTGYSPVQLVSMLRQRLRSHRAALYWFLRLRQVLSGSVSSWFYCWLLSSFLKDGLHVYPGSNLVVNHGFGEQSTHTARKEPYMPVAYGPTLPGEIVLPCRTAPCDAADRWLEDNMYSKSLPVRLSWIMKKLNPAG